jgi:hypothetical protein
MENEFDLEALEAEFEADFTEESDESAENEADEQEIESDEEVDSDNEDGLEADEETDDEIDQDDTEEDPDNDNESESDNEDNQLNSNENEVYQRQVAQLQQQLDEAKRSADLIDQIATQNGISKDELIKQFEQSRLAEEAKKQNVPVEFLQKQRDMEAELTALKENNVRQQFNSQVASVKDKYDLTDDDIKNTIEFSITNGLDVFNPNVKFESVYKAANFDKLVEQQVKAARQKELASKQERMKKATVPHGGSGNTSAPSVDDDVQSFLREQGII